MPDGSWHLQLWPASALFFVLGNEEVGEMGWGKGEEKKVDVGCFEIGMEC